MTDRLLLIAIVAAMLAGCGPDPAVEHAALRQSLDASTAAFDTGDWHGAQDHLRLGEQRVIAHPDLALEGATLGTRYSEAEDAFEKRIDEQLDRLIVAARVDRAGLAAVTTMVLDQATPPTQSRWRDQVMPEANALFSTREADAERERLRRVSESYVLWAVSDGGLRERSVTSVRDALAKQIEQRVAPFGVVVVDKPPTDPRAHVGTIKLTLAWETVSYGTTSGFPDPLSTVPEGLQVTATIATRIGSGSIDGAHVWSAKRPAPTEINGRFGVNGLRDRQVRDLSGTICQQAAQLPQLADGEVLQAALRAERGAPEKPVWRYRVASETVNPDRQQNGKHGYESMGDDLAIALRPWFDGELVPEGVATDAPTAGTVDMSLLVMEITYGSGNGAIRTIAYGGIPVSLSLSIVVTGPDGKPLRKPRSLEAEVDPPETIDKETMGMLVVQQSDKLVAEIAAQVKADPH